MLTALSEFGNKEIIKLLNIILVTGKIPADLKRSEHISLPRKNGCS